MPESADQYKKWFKRDFVPRDSLYMSHLPSLHTLLFLFVNNILIPKASIKTNMEWGPTYYLRHLITLDETKKVNISYIFLSHMQHARMSKVASLPYAHLIHNIIRLNGIVITPDELTEQPANLVDSLLKYGWLLGETSSSLPCFRPDNRSVNEWILEENAQPNQYWDPN
jgi:hypothetical protein